MNNQFDELAKGLAQSVTRRQALRRFGRFGAALAGITLASLGLANKAEAAPQCRPSGHRCRSHSQCCSGYCDPSEVGDRGTCF